MIKYGLISETDGRTIEKTIDLLRVGDTYEFNITEIGLYNCETSFGIKEYLKSKHCEVNYTGIDNEKDKKMIAPSWMKLIIGDADEVAFRLEDNSQHICFIDACHCFAHVISNFFSYAAKVKVGGFICFHDTGKHIKPFKDFQHGDKENPDAYISVRKALEVVGLLLTDNQWMDKYGRQIQFVYGRNECFELIFDEADENNEAGGICVFKKLY